MPAVFDTGTNLLVLDPSRPVENSNPVTLKKKAGAVVEARGAGVDREGPLPCAVVSGQGSSAPMNLETLETFTFPTTRGQGAVHI